MKRVELLAPAGGYETMIGAFNAGADAVYLGGSKFGARAYADNFDRDQVLDAITYAHLNGKKIYMTVNTLVKEREFGELYEFMLPFAQKKLDGVIVQDLGVMKFIRDEFPEIELHASTQQTVTGVNGARLLKKLGCCRVVPARELSLSEMVAIRNEADVEVEAFIHGAMCYCYSGVCLFSSMVGERSGNRGRCAQPCRLPYQSGSSFGKDECYPLSLKDMCTINIIPQLIEAGIDSFKIEGRMKKPEYAAGVTALYRKYIDMYYEKPSMEIKVSREDIDILKSLYLRTEISEGYYNRHNGREMVTIGSPAYNGTSEKVLSEIREKYLDKTHKIGCEISCEIVLGQPVVLSMCVCRDGEEIWESVTGNMVDVASKRPIDEETVKKQLLRLGNTNFSAENIVVKIDDKGKSEGLFVPVSELNDLRRSLCEKMEKALLGDKEAVIYDNNFDDISLKDFSKVRGDIQVLVNTKDQLDAVLDCLSDDIKVSGIYIDSNLIYNLDFESVRNLKNLCSEKNIKIIAALPFITRNEDWMKENDIEDIIDKAYDGIFDGVLVRNLEQIGIVFEKHNERGKSIDVITDYGVYVWNRESAALLTELPELVSGISSPLELTFHELKEMAQSVKTRLSRNMPITYNIYGRAPMMVSAGCIKKTLDNCSGRMGKHHVERTNLIDRMGNNMVVTTNCRNCYNVIWNTYPTSLHKKLDKIVEAELFDHFRLDFTVENARETGNIIRAYAKCLERTEKLSDNKKRSNITENIDVFDDLKFTTGHFKRGVE